MIFSEFKNKWDSVPDFNNGFISLDIDHPLTFQIGHYDISHKSFVIMDTGEIKNIPSTFAVKVDNPQLTNGEYVLEFRLIHNNFEEEYLRLCWDMINSSANVPNPISAFIDRYKSWNRLLQTKNDKAMPYQAQKGLLGELLYLKECIDTDGISKAIRAWQGPDGSDQDFLFETTWTEVKSVAASSESVKISSLQQLKHEQEGELRVYFLEKSVENSDNYNLVKMINKIRDVLIEEPYYKDLFEMKIYKYGYRDADEEMYKDTWFRKTGVNSYTVNSKFPKLTADNTAAAIVACSYELSLAAIEGYRR